jgi:hypothetical protein
MNATRGAAVIDPTMRANLGKAVSMRAATGYGVGSRAQQRSDALDNVGFDRRVAKPLTAIPN